jgi:hypothetical protein
MDSVLRVVAAGVPRGVDGSLFESQRRCCAARNASIGLSIQGRLIELLHERGGIEVCLVSGTQCSRHLSFFTVCVWGGGGGRQVNIECFSCCQPPCWWIECVLCPCHADCILFDMHRILFECNWGIGCVMCSWALLPHTAHTIWHA